LINNYKSSLYKISPDGSSDPILPVTDSVQQEGCYKKGQSFQKFAKTRKVLTGHFGSILVLFPFNAIVQQ
jgi:hypothetical protein